MTTIDAFQFCLILFAALGSGLIAGVFFAFSSFVMRTLSRLPTSGGIAAMQSINVVVLNPVFLGAFIGTAILGILTAVAALFTWHDTRSMYMLVGGALYVVGTFLVTIVFNVPWNNRLAVVTPYDPESANVWEDYLVKWTAWNHVRTAAAFGATAALTLALCN